MFEQLMTTNVITLLSKEEIMEACKGFENKGKISLEDVKFVLTEGGQKKSKDEPEMDTKTINNFIKQFDVDGNDSVDIERFVEILHSQIIGKGFNFCL
eukprot:UN02542